MTYIENFEQQLNIIKRILEYVNYYYENCLSKDYTSATSREIRNTIYEHHLELTNLSENLKFDLINQLETARTKKSKLEIFNRARTLGRNNYYYFSERLPFSEFSELTIGNHNGWKNEMNLLLISYRTDINNSLKSAFPDFQYPDDRNNRKEISVTEMVSAIEPELFEVILSNLLILRYINEKRKWIKDVVSFVGLLVLINDKYLKNSQFHIEANKRNFKRSITPIYNYFNPDFTYGKVRVELSTYLGYQLDPEKVKTKDYAVYQRMKKIEDHKKLIANPGLKIAKK